MMRTLAIFLGLCLSLLLGSDSALALDGRGMLQGVHGDSESMPRSCRACHRGMRMAVDGEEGGCLACHGGAAERAEMEKRGYLAGSGALDMADIETELRKPYAHPVLSVAGAHRRREALPEEVVNAPRHSECVDCHEPHLVKKDDPYRGLPGRRVGNFVSGIEKEYELCYRCHAESANLPSGSSDKHSEFKTTNPSYHPVEGEGRSAAVISLKAPYAAAKEKPGEISIISCGDCHGSDGGVGGPHGSNYPGLLRYHYEMEDGRSESEFAYALCYRCHERSSILGNESFPLHSRHIEGSRDRGQAGTSCFSCHDAHGSATSASLIRFNEEVVLPAADGRLEFESDGTASRRGSCSLRCHGVEHDRNAY